ncbi:hypothetical protein GOP47_0007778 [Adiantum capillus-veneris]|uniref:Uncharacterized protein n=1 Tax=Adiantum capillus-veneris TaxID=13818 RepID=A0A9D4V1H8_ADICA|nr:hypothetical protein GOP47_0007778 [Adiantum capillus-veneris]
MMRRIAIGMVLLVAGVLMNNSEASEQQFCERAEASGSCAKPPTVDEEGFKVEDYLGKWYEIGSTASFKLLNEAGLVCNQARYSASASGNLSLLNSGLRVISPLALAEVVAVNVAARGACAAAREVCHQLAAVSQLTRSLATLDGHDAHLLQISQQLKTSTQAAQQALNDLSEDVSLIQQANGQISQANPSSSLQSSVAALNRYVKEGRQVEQGALTSLVSTLNKIRGQVKDASHKSGLREKSKAALEHAALSLASIALKVGASNNAIELSLKAVGVGAKALAGNGHPVNDASVSSVSGSIIQPNATSPAKLAVSIIGNKAPYWIIALEKSKSSQSMGAYSAALVYSCSEVAGVTAKSLFVLSREAQLQRSTLDAFLAKAESFGIYNDCEDPFLLTLQRGGNCGQPSSAS